MQRQVVRLTDGCTEVQLWISKDADSLPTDQLLAFFSPSVEAVASRRASRLERCPPCPVQVALKDDRVGVMVVRHQRAAGWGQDQIVPERHADVLSVQADDAFRRRAGDQGVVIDLDSRHAVTIVANVYRAVMA